MFYYYLISTLAHITPDGFACDYSSIRTLFHVSPLTLLETILYYTLLPHLKYFLFLHLFFSHPYSIHFLSSTALTISKICGQYNINHPTPAILPTSILFSFSSLIFNPFPYPSNSLFYYLKYENSLYHH